MPYWERGMNDLRSDLGRKLAEELLEKHPDLTRKQEKVVTSYFFLFYMGSLDCHPVWHENNVTTHMQYRDSYP